MDNNLVRKFLALVLVLSSSSQCQARLQVGFYRRTCYFAELIIKDEVGKAFINDQGIAAGLLRMHFHDCFVRVCDASITLDSVSPNKAEKDSLPNNPSLRGFEVIDNAKARLEKLCAGVVSCADILAFAARDSTGGFRYDVPAGRRDGLVSLASEALENLPAPTLNVDQLTQASFSSRLYNFNSTTSQDPSLDPTYADELKDKCLEGSNDPNLAVPMNPESPNFMDNSYYQDVITKRGLFTSDLTLLTDPSRASQVGQYAINQLIWRTDFTAAMVKMGMIGVLVGNDGEIRLNCRKRN
ncbi:hypothetical protein ACLOJK_027220 [Asimina triloba]